MIAMELCQRGDLLAMLENDKENLTQNKVLIRKLFK